MKQRRDALTRKGPVMANSTSCSGRHVASITIMLLCAAGGVARGQGGSPDTRSAAGRPDSRAPAVDTARERLLLNARLAQSFRVADLNGDGIQDIAFSDFLADVVLLRFGDADGRFSRSIVLPAPGGPRSIVAVDLDKDGFVDLAVAGFFSGAVRIFMGRGNGEFNAPELVAVSPGLTGLTAADYDGDGAIDLATSNVLSGAVTLLKRGSNQWTHVPLGHSTSPTLLLTGDTDGNGAPDLVAVDADGSENYLFPSGRLGAFNQRDAAHTVETLLADVEHQPGHIETNAQRQGKTTSGDGQVAAAGSMSPEWLSVQVRDRAGAARPGETVFFTRVAGMAELMDATATEARATDVRITDEQGSASAQVLLPPLPGVSVFAATFPREYTATFGVISFVQYKPVVEAIVAALAREIRDPGLYAAHVALLSRALESIDASDPVAAVREVVTSAELLQRTGSTPSADARTPGAVDLERLMIDQILLAGISPQLAENQPILCDVPIRTTIAAATEVDRFTFNGVALEIVHISVGNEGGTNFNPVVTLIGPGGPVVSCATISSNADCTLPASGAYTVQVVDGSSNGTGTYSVHLQRLTADRRCGGSIACDVPVTSTLGTAARADTNLHSFSAAANERVHVSIGNQGGTNFNPFFRVLAPTGAVVSGCSFTNSNVDCLLPVAGSYGVEVLDGSFDGTGTYSLHIQRLTAEFRCGGQARCGTALTPAALGAVARADSDLWSFGGVIGSVNIAFTNLGGTAFNPVWRVVSPTRTTTSGSTFSARPLAPCALPSDGSYAVEVLDSSFDGPGRYALTVSGPGCRGLPNLTVSSLACGVRTAPGGTITVSVRTANTGDAAAPASQTGIYLSVNNTFDGDTALLPKISVPALAAGASASAAVAVTIPVATAPGEDFIIALADDRQVTPEGSERNNATACPLTVGPDLLISSIVAPASAVRGTAVVAAITVRNDGGATAAASVLRLHFSTDNVISADDTFVTVTVPSLVANTATTVNATITIPAAAAIGTRFFIGAADASSVVKESDEANNRLAKSIVVQ